VIREGAIVLVRSLTAEGAPDKARPAVVVKRVPGPHDDWLIAMISTQLHQAVPDFDVVLISTDSDFAATRLKSSSVIRAGRLAVVNFNRLLGRIGDLAPHRITQLQRAIAAWISASPGSPR
jgi:mRNA interferase MazF